MREADLYPPLKAALEALGFEAKGEVQGCDVVAVRGDEVVVVELKRQLNLTVLLQAVDRFAITDDVYVGVPAGLAVWRRDRKRVLKLLRRVGLGLVLIGDRVEFVLDPNPSRPRRDPRRQARLKHEFETRVGDPVRGGLPGSRARLTAYRQRAVTLAIALRDGPAKASILAKDVGDPKARDVLYRNVYGWFRRQGGGIYELSERGVAELPRWRR